MASESYKIPSRKKIKDWIRILPGTKRDYFLLTLVVIDIVLITFRASYSTLLGNRFDLTILIFDISVIVLWFFDFIHRLRKEEDKIDFIKTHWYEVVGMVPLIILRPFLLLRGAKLAIAFYKLGRSDEEISRSLTQEITFRFRDIIVDTIADAVFLQSLERVEEIMLKLDYSQLAHNAFEKHYPDLQKVVKDSLLSKSMMGELSRVPFMQGFIDRTGEDVTSIIMETLETEVTGNIMKDITRGILREMYGEVKKLDIERLTGQRFDPRGVAREIFDKEIEKENYDGSSG